MRGRKATDIDTLTDDVAELQASAPDWVVLDFTKPDACVIDQSGHYVLDRSWSADGISGNITCHTPDDA